MKKLYRINFSTLHDGCWTSNVKDKVVTLNISKHNNNKIKVSIISPRLLIKDLEKSENVYDILKYRTIKGGYIIDFLEEIDSTVSGYLLSDNNVLYHKNIVRQKLEKWEIISLSKSVINKLTEKFNINSISINEIKPSDILYYGLSEKELLVLKNAISMGYFNYPRAVKANDVAKKLGISKQDFLYHLRNSINKLVSSIDLD
ncbi:helix-turn-helix domain-containing protein [Stygiolobus caldivivus]|uniref:XRE family transcriptional regulator n=1 Tax=Stygiolobus caldivivus TaxID=2824673 RepID=A0A8D5U5P8_9CREN|nr:helix-turn-helix domain-containing protein [Stygiolobus caldivivus]BCU69784.1 XRE family transcriptional regulator [Stygiolobus caldivivus]